MEKTNTATTAATTHQLIHDFFETHGADTVRNNMQVMAAHFFASDEHCQQARLPRLNNADMVLQLNVLIENLYELHKE